MPNYLLNYYNQFHLTSIYLIYLSIYSIKNLLSLAIVKP